jgi:hypothetical protein
MAAPTSNGILQQKGIFGCATIVIPLDGLFVWTSPSIQGRTVPKNCFIRVTLVRTNCGAKTLKQVGGV